MVKYLSCKHDDLVWLPRIHLKMLGVLVVLVIMVLGEERQEGLWNSMSRESSVIGELQANNSKEMDSVPKDDIEDWWKRFKNYILSI